MKFSEWLAKRDPTMYQDIQEGWGRKLMMGTALVGGMYGKSIYNYFNPASYEGPPAATATAHADSPQKQVDHFILSGSGPVSMNFQHYEIVGGNIGDIKSKIDGESNRLTRFAVDNIVNRRTFMSVVKPGATGDNLNISTGEGGQTFHLENQEITIELKDKTFYLTPDKFPDQLKGVLDAPLSVHVSQGWIKMRVTGSITISQTDSAN